MARIQTTYFIITFILFTLLSLLAGCGRNTEGMRILESLRDDGLLRDYVNVPSPKINSSEIQQSWSFPTEGELSLSLLLEAANHLNPSIAAAHAQIGTVGGRAWQASLYPNPSLDFESENISTAGGFSTSESTVGISQPIIIGGRREAAAAIGEARLIERRWELERLRLQVHGQISRKVTEIVYYKQAIQLHEELRLLAMRTLEISQARFDARAAPESESIRARVEVNYLGLAIEKLRGDIAAAGEKLDSLLGGQHIDLNRLGRDMLDTSLTDQVPALDELLKTIRNNHPAVLAAEANVKAAMLQVDLERALRHPDIMARFGVGVNHSDDDEFIEAGISIPLPLYDNNQGNILAARFGVIRAQKEAKATLNELTGMLGEAYKRWESATSRLAVFEEQILSGSQRSYDQTTVAYEAGKLPFVDLLDVQRTLIEANIAQIELRQTAGLIRSEIYEIMGEYPMPNHKQKVKP